MSWIKENKLIFISLGVAALLFFGLSLIVSLSDDPSPGIDEGIIYAYSDQCQYCQNFGPKFEQAVAGFPDMTVERWNIHEDIEKHQKAVQLGLTATPTVFAVKEGKVVDTLVGDVSELHVRKFILRTLSDE